MSSRTKQKRRQKKRQRRSRVSRSPRPRGAYSPGFPRTLVTVTLAAISVTLIYVAWGVSSSTQIYVPIIVALIELSLVVATIVGVGQWYAFRKNNSNGEDRK